MKNVSKKFSDTLWQDWHGNRQAVPAAIRKVANAFVDLQDDRHSADYDNHENWTVADAASAIGTARSAFQNWEAIRTDPMAGNYLLAMLLNKQRS